MGCSPSGCGSGGGMPPMGGMPMPIAMNPMDDFMPGLMATILRCAFDDAGRAAILTDVVNASTQHVKARFERMRESPMFSNAVIDGSLAKIEDAYIKELKAIANMFNGAELFNLNEKPKDETPSEGAKSSIILD